MADHKEKKSFGLIRALQRGSKGPSRGASVFGRLVQTGARAAAEKKRRERK